MSICISKPNQLLNFRNTLFTQQNGFNNKPNSHWWINVCRSFTSQSGRKTGVIKREIVCCQCEWLLIAIWNRRPTTTKISSARYFYNHPSNYTKAIFRLRLVNIGKYSPGLRLGEYSPTFTSPSARRKGASPGKSLGDSSLPVWRHVIHHNLVLRVLPLPPSRKYFLEGGRERTLGTRLHQWFSKWRRNLLYVVDSKIYHF